MAHGVRCDGKKKLQDVVDHLHGTPHAAAMERRTLTRQWASKDKNYPWINTVCSHDPGVVRSLVHMAIDAYNDSKLLTQSAWSWPSRSLAQLHAEQQYKKYGESDVAFTRYEPTPTELHYRDPVHYAEMLHIIGGIEREKLKKDLQSCLRFSVQINGSVDGKQQDKKFVFVRFSKKDDVLSNHVRFISAREVEKHGAAGLFEALVSALESIGLTKQEIKSKCAGITTDGEAANTGRESGLWRRLEQYLGHQTINIWCACHRSDLAMEDVIRSVPELKIWKMNVTAVATFYRSSGLSTKELKKIIPRMKIFPGHHDVRFAQHLIQLCQAVLDNLHGCREHWQAIIDAPSRKYERHEKEKARGFVNLWKPCSHQT